MTNVKPDYLVYDDGEIAVALFAEDEEADRRNLLHLGMRWLLAKPLKGKDGQMVQTTNVMGGETDWFLLPHSFGTAVGRTLIEQKVGGLEYFNEDGYKRMVSWLADMGEIEDGMCY
jgi:hypothetical protein